MSLALSEHLPLIAAAPDGIQKLRGLIYELAAKGVLEPPDDTSPAQILNLGDIAEFVMGQAPPGNECNTNGDGTIFVKTGEFGETYPVVREWTTKPLKYAKQGDVLICVVGATVGKLNLAIDCAIGRSVAAIRPSDKLDTRYLYASLVPFTLRLRQQSRGSAQGVIGKTELNSVQIRFPSKKEQLRIVSKLDVLMALCDRLESEQNDSAAAHTQLVETLLGTLTQSTDAADFEANWKRVAEHFDTLFTTEASIDALQKTILQLAVIGKLVEQDQSEEPANNLLKRIDIEKKRLEIDGKIKKSKQLPAVSEEEKNFSAPNGWAWCRLQHAFDVRDGTHDSPKFLGNGIPFLTSKNIYGGKLDLTDLKFISESDHIEFSKRSKVDQGDILFAMIGSIGNPVIVNTDMDFSFKNMALFKYFSKALSSPEFLQTFLSVIAADMKAKAAGGVQSFVALGTIRNQPIALPPLSEQHRIVAKVDELMAVCDSLKNQLAESRNQEGRLADTLIQASLKAA